MTLRRVVFAVLLTFALCRPAAADITGFIGATTTPSTRSTAGVAAGGGLLIFGFEFEYASTADDENERAPSLKMGMGNVLLQTPFAIYGFQPYWTAGAGIYHEQLDAFERTGFGANTGLGVKISLAGPLRLRIDYRALRLGDDALYSPVHRIYAGLNLKF
jgi:hypothetical protein